MIMIRQTEDVAHTRYSRKKVIRRIYYFIRKNPRTFSQSCSLYIRSFTRMSEVWPRK